MGSVPHIGEAFALLAPICWSVAVILFRKSGESVPPLALNLFKNLLGLLLFVLTLLVLRESAPPGSGARGIGLLLVSGAIGIGISDTLFFMTLNRVGAGLQAIINASYSPAIILMSFFFLGERLAPLQFLGVALILAAVLAVTRMRGPSGGRPTRALVIGIVLGLLTSLTQAVSIVMIKRFLEQSPLVWANSCRLLGGIVMTLGLLSFMPQPQRRLDSLRSRRAWRIMVPAAVLGTYLSLLLWLGGMKYTQASTAAVLNQTSMLWTFALAALLLHEPVSRLRIVGLIVGAAGVALVTFGG